MQLCGLWRRRTKAGEKPFLAGTIIGDLQLMIFPNEKKREGKKDPDYYAVLVLPQAQRGEDGERGQRDREEVPF